MLDYLVEWARIKYVAEVFVPTKIKLNHYVDKVYATLKETAAINKLELINKISRDCSVFVDEKMLISILHNLVSNAIKHSTLEGIISISAIQNDKEVVVEIKDNGLGMSKEIKNNLFSPKIKSLLKGVEENKGAGIGLLLVNGFIEKIGGRIWVESQEGSGTSFFFTLPMENGDNMKPQIANKE